MPYVLQQIFQFSSPRDLIRKLQFLSTTARTAIYSHNQFLRWSLKNFLGQWHHTKLQMSGKKEESKEQTKREEEELREAARVIIEENKYPSPVQCLAFRSTLAD